MPYDDIAQAAALANDSEYGLSAALFGEEREARAVARQLEAGAVSINDGGLTTEGFDAEKNAFKLSGLGASRMGPSGIARFLRKRAVLIQHGKVKDMPGYDTDIGESNGRWYTWQGLLRRDFECGRRRGGRCH